MRELCATYEKDWMLVKILHSGASHGDEPCIMLARGSRAAMFRAERKVRKEDKTSLLGIIGGGTIFGGGEAARKALARAAEEEEWVSVNPW